MSARILAPILLTTLLFPLFLRAQQAQAEAITIEQGLSQGMIFDICQTRDGFLWMATKDGLNRYDGYNFKIFSNNPFDPYSLAENTVTALLEDRRGWLWIATESTGLEVYDRHSGRFLHLPLRYGLPGANGFMDKATLCEAPDGSIYLLQKGNFLVRIAVPAEWEDQLPGGPLLNGGIRITHFSFDRSGGSRDTGWAALINLTPGENGEMLAYSLREVYRLDTASGRIRPAAPKSGPGRRVWCSAPHALVCFQNGKPAPVALPVGMDIRTNLTKPVVNGAYWLAINGHLWYVEPGRMPDFSNPGWVLDADISALATDRNGNIWVGTQGYGLRKINPRKALFHKGAAGSSIWGLWRDLRGRYFCKVWNIVYPYDPQSGKLGTQPAFPDGPRRILDMCIDPSGAYWLLGRGDAEFGSAELRWYDPETGASKSYPFPFDSTAAGQPAATQWFKPYTYARLFQSRDGRLWATSLNGQLVRFDPRTAHFDRFDYAALFGEQAGTVRAFAIAEDGNGTLWTGTQLGLVKGIPDNDKFRFELLQADPANPNGLNHNSISCLLPDPAAPRDRLWIGTKGGGINRLDLRSGRVEHIDTRSGLPDNVVYGILPGETGELWCSTNRGLGKLKPGASRGDYRITAFMANQGLQDNEFNTQAFSKAANGELLFGGVNGLNRFFPKAVLPDTTPPPVFVVGLRINHQPADFSGSGLPDAPSPEFLQTLELRHDQNNLSFEFAVLDFTNPAKNRYRYRLAGVDTGWVETGAYRFAHFTHLAPGRYTLFVQGNNGEGAWQDVSNRIEITILPPWWRSRLAYLLYALALLLALWQAYRFQVRRLQLREQLAWEHRETARVKALEQMKTNFFNNVTHEFRTPLTLILEPARRILAGSRDPETRENARHIETNSRRLLNLVNQLLDLAKIESGNLRLDLRYDDFAGLVREVYRNFLPLAEQRGVQLGLDLPPGIPMFRFDAHKAETILHNLLSNALKFTPEGGSVRLTALIEPGTETASFILVKVTDTGAGIAPADAEKVFDRFYQAENAYARQGQGTGIGLALSKELAIRMGGSLQLERPPGPDAKGASFVFRLPMRDSGALPEGRADSDAPGSPERTTPPPAAADTERPVVLLIEDNAELRGFIKQCIGDRWQVVEAPDGEAGEKSAAELLPDLVISDVMMPGKDGYAVCEALKNNELTSHIPVILLTAKSAAEAKIKGLRTGADDYLTKPFNTDELLARMENLVEMRRSLRRRYAQLAPAALSAGEGKTGDTLPAADREFLRRFVALVEQHLSDETIGVEEFAQKMFISRVQLHRKLKAVTGKNVTDFVRDYRLERAMALLRNGEGKVYEIAARVGFGSEKYFSRAFKEKFGISPGQVS